MNTNANSTRKTAKVHKAATCTNGEHWTRDRNGRFMWSLEDECIVHGTGREWR